MDTSTSRKIGAIFVVLLASFSICPLRPPFADAVPVDAVYHNNNDGRLNVAHVEAAASNATKQLRRTSGDTVRATGEAELSRDSRALLRSPLDVLSTPRAADERQSLTDYINPLGNKVEYLKQQAYYALWTSFYAKLNVLSVGAALAGLAFNSINAANLLSGNGKGFKDRVAKKIFKRMREKMPHMFKDITDSDVEAMENFLTEKYKKKFEADKSHKDGASDLGRFYQDDKMAQNIDWSNLDDYVPEGLRLPIPGFGGPGLFPGALGSLGYSHFGGYPGLGFPASPALGYDGVFGFDGLGPVGDGIPFDGLGGPAFPFGAGFGLKPFDDEFFRSIAREVAQEEAPSSAVDPVAQAFLGSALSAGAQPKDEEAAGVFEAPEEGGSDLVTLQRTGKHPLLATPVPSQCASRRQDIEFGGHTYQLSWLSEGAPVHDWFNARNYCRKFCMDLISLETEDENLAIKDMLTTAWKDGKIQDIWTSGRICDFDGCDREDLQPLNINGWFWTATFAKIFVPGRGFNDWGANQPDNKEGGESCVAFVNPQAGGGGGGGEFRWHDAGCHYRKPFVCEDSDALLAYYGKLSDAEAAALDTSTPAADAESKPSL